MATNQVNPVNVAIQTLTPNDLNQDDKENKKRTKTASVFDVPSDSVDVGPSDSNVAPTASAMPPAARTPHERVKAQRSTLETALKNAGVELKPGEDLVSKSHIVLDGLDAKISALLEKGGKEGELATLESQRDTIIDSLNDLEAIQAAAVDNVQTVQTASATGQTDVSTDVPTGNLTPEEAKALWPSLSKDLKTIGLNVDQGETDITLVQNQAVAQVTKELDKLKAKETDLTAKKTELENQLKTASPEDQKRIQSEIKTVQTDLNQVLQQTKDLKVAFVKINEALVHFQAAKDLGVSFTEKTESRPTVKTSSVTPTSSSKTTRSASVKTASVTTTSTPKSSPTTTSGSGFTLSTASAGGTGGGAALTTGGETFPESGLLGTASVEGGDAPPTTGGDLLSTSAYAELQSSLSGNTLAIASTSNQVQADGRRTDSAIKKLLQAAASGNYEAIKTALILLDKRASETVIGMGTATIKAMQNYETQMATLSKSLDSLKSSDPSYNAKLAQVNSQMNTYSMNRQSIANFLQQVMTSREEIGNTTKGFIQKDGQIGSAMSRW